MHVVYCIYAQMVGNTIHDGTSFVNSGASLPDVSFQFQN